jgi:Lon protease-like protein
MSARIPIFPLELVLFPSQPLPLHIFEPRYKLMIKHCLAKNSEFGIILALQDGIAGVGCSARIAEVVKTYPDGRMDLVAVGTYAFRLLEVFDEQPYFEAQVEVPLELPDLGEPLPDKVLLALFEHFQRLVFGKIRILPEAARNESLAFRMAADLPLDLRFKQELLETATETERRKKLLVHLEQLLPVVQELAQQRPRTSGDGHAPN